MKNRVSLPRLNLKELRSGAFRSLVSISLCEMEGFLREGFPKTNPLQDSKGHKLLSSIFKTPNLHQARSEVSSFKRGKKL